MDRRVTPAAAMAGLTSMVATAIIAWIVIIATGAPLLIAVIVGVALFCIDIASLAMVWYTSGRS